MPTTVARRTIYLPKDVEKLARDNAEEGESFSATIARLVQAGARKGAYPDWIGSGEGPEDLGLNAEKYLKEIFEEFSD